MGHGVLLLFLDGAQGMPSYLVTTWKFRKAISAVVRLLDRSPKEHWLFGHQLKVISSAIILEEVKFAKVSFYLASILK